MEGFFIGECLVIVVALGEALGRNPGIPGGRFGKPGIISNVEELEAALAMSGPTAGGTAPATARTCAAGGGMAGVTGEGGKAPFGVSGTGIPLLNSAGAKGVAGAAKAAFGGVTGLCIKMIDQSPGSCFTGRIACSVE